MQMNIISPPARKYTALIHPDWWTFTSYSAILGYITAGMITWFDSSAKMMGFK